jgi:hypothetical protein
MTNEEPEDRSDNSESQAKDETAGRAKGTTKNVENAFRDTLQSYLDRAGIKFDMRALEENIVGKPLVAAGIAAAGGFILGGGMATSLGKAMLSLVGRKAARDTASTFVSGVVKAKVL